MPVSVISNCTFNFPILHMCYFTTNSWHLLALFMLIGGATVLLCHLQACRISFDLEEVPGDLRVAVLALHVWPGCHIWAVSHQSQVPRHSTLWPPPLHATVRKGGTPTSQFHQTLYWPSMGTVGTVGLVQLRLVIKWFNPWCIDIETIFSCDQAALRTLLSVRLSIRLVCLSHLFHNVPLIVSSWNCQELLPLTKVMSMQEGQGQRSRSQRSKPNLAIFRL